MSRISSNEYFMISNRRMREIIEARYFRERVLHCSKPTTQCLSLSYLDCYKVIF